MSYYVYVLKSEKDGSLYIGMTSNVEKRLAEHNAGKTRSTRTKRPYRLFHFVEVHDRLQARDLEKMWKSGSGREQFK